MREDDSRLLDFDPTSAVPPLTDPNPDDYSAVELEETTRSFIVERTQAWRDV